jgi:RimJ/RimL family protein N-acetyltransferase
MNFSIQPILENENLKLIPLWENDFERLYEVASDPEIWEQHPNKNRYEIEVFRNFFKGAVESKGAFLVLDKSSDEIAGSTRFYDFNDDENSIFIGYTFYGTKFWGKGINPQIKKMMLDYVFQFTEKVIFHVGATNFRSQKAMEKLGAIKTTEIEVAYFGEAERLNFQYEIKKEDWLNQ